ncbi:MAG: hypothetical protein LBF64_03695 [Oscillospiraceae bacterium]|jgi:hypothetical protein|nr:hypothetical protein [Oscillospiraceae bacterium]
MKRLKRRAAAVGFVLMLSVSIMQTSFAVMMENVTSNYLANEDLAPGIHYFEEDLHGYGESGNRRLRMNRLSVDPKADGVVLNSARAEDTINARENILNQALRDVYQGANVVASVNADSYDMDYG